MAIDMRLAKKGRSESRLGLVEQGNVSAGLAKAYAKELADNGWLAQDTAVLVAGWGRSSRRRR